MQPEKRQLLVELSTGSERPAMPEAPVLSSAHGPWPGVLLEHFTGGACVENLEVASPEHVVIVHLHEATELEWKHHGRFQPVRLLPGQGVILPALQPFSNRIRHSSEFVAVALDQTFLRCAAHDQFSGMDRLELRSMVPVDDPLLYAIAVALKAEAEAGYPGGRSYGETLAGALAAHLVRHYSNARPFGDTAEGGLSRHQLRRAIDYLQVHLAAAVSIAAMAGEAGLSQFHFARLFKHSTGLTPHQYLIQRRVERARELLLADGKTTAEIALEVGFCDQSHLTTHFKRAFGMTPKRFRDSRNRGPAILQPAVPPEERAAGASFVQGRY